MGQEAASWNSSKSLTPRSQDRTDTSLPTAGAFQVVPTAALNLSVSARRKLDVFVNKEHGTAGRRDPRLFTTGAPPLQFLNWVFNSHYFLSAAGLVLSRSRRETPGKSWQKIVPRLRRRRTINHPKQRRWEGENQSGSWTSWAASRRASGWTSPASYWSEY